MLLVRGFKEGGCSVRAILFTSRAGGKTKRARKAVGIPRPRSEEEEQVLHAEEGSHWRDPHESWYALHSTENPCWSRRKA